MGEGDGPAQVRSSAGSGRAEQRRKERRELFIVVEGPDGSGKGEGLRALIQKEQRLGRCTFDTISFSRAESKGAPELKDFWCPPVRHYHTVITEEPTYAGIGKVIREEIIQKNGRNYSPIAERQAYALDREVQMKRVVIPALLNGVRVLQSRCLASSLTYQAITAEAEGKSIDEARNVILEEYGNQLQLEYAPDLLIIQHIKDPQELMRRMEARRSTTKDDNAIFENSDFQRRLNELYQDQWLKSLFEKHGTNVVYVDTSISPEETRSQVLRHYESFLENKAVRQNP